MSLSSLSISRVSAFRIQSAISRAKIAVDCDQATFFVFSAAREGTAAFEQEWK